LAQQELSRTEVLSAASDFNRLGYQHDLNIRDTALRQAETDLERLRRGIGPLLALDLRRAQLVLEQLKEGVDPLLVNAVDKAQLDLERLQEYVSDAQVFAPIDGEVVSLFLLPGRPVEAFQTVLTIANPDAIEVRAQLGSDQLQELVEGQKATVILDSGPSREWEGMIARLPRPYGSSGVLDSEIDFGNAVLVCLQGDVGKLKPGDVVQVTVVVAEKNEVLWLPVGTVRTMQGRPFVVIQDEGRQRRVNVALGLEGTDQIEIVTGLEEGQVILFPDRMMEVVP
jgi:HlyD family secretion protein